MLTDLLRLPIPILHAAWRIFRVDTGVHAWLGLCPCQAVTA